MSKLDWYEEDRRYFSGVDKVVLYSTDGTSHPWSGVTKVQLQKDVEGKSYYYQDGRKLGTNPLSLYVAGTVTCLHYPEAFDAMFGNERDVHGVLRPGNEDAKAALSYRRYVSKNTNDMADYQMVVVYDALFGEPMMTSDTFAQTPNPEEFVFGFQTYDGPNRVTGKISYNVYDSREIGWAKMFALEESLHGSSRQTPKLRTASQITTLFDNIQTAHPNNASYGQLIEGSISQRQPANSYRVNNGRVYYTANGAQWTDLGVLPKL